MRPVHFLFNPSGAATLRSALSQKGPPPLVLALFDDLSFAPLSSKRRAEWWEENFYPEWEDVRLSQNAQFWAKASSRDTEPTVWVNRRSPQEYTGLLSFTANTHGRPFRLIDVTDIKIQYPRHTEPTDLVSIGGLLPDTYLEILCSNVATSVNANWIQTCLKTWSRLVEEDAILRLVDADGQLVSVHEDFFDEWILRFVTNEWTRAARVIGEAMGAYYSECRRSVGDLYLSRRLHLLAKASLVEVKGELGSLHDYSVRHPQRR